MVLQSSELKYTYPNLDPMPFPDIDLAPEEAALILGASGSGKSTLLHLLSGLLDLQAGEVQVLGQNLAKLNPRELERFRAKHFGLILQNSYFLPYLSLIENLQLSARYQGQKVTEARIKELFDYLNITHLAQKKPAECSVGEQQRASIARALMHKPQIILADEPSSALDDRNAELVGSLLLEMGKNEKSALLVVTHDSRLKSIISKSYAL